jgi:pimeloyl-ACP methyl ester carboxylesterase
MGGWIGWGCLVYAPQRFEALAIGGMGPVPDPYFGKSVEDFFGARWAGFDAERQRVLRLVFGETSRFGGARQALKTSSAPLFLFCGDRDPRYESMRDSAPLGRNAEFLTLPGKDHGGVIRDADSVATLAPRLIDFFAAHAISRRD